MQMRQRLIFVQFVKRFLTGAALLIVLLFAVRLAWGWEAANRLAATERDLISRHFELDSQDSQAAPVPDDQNAAVALQEAFNAERIDLPEAGRGEGRMFAYGRGYWGSFADPNAEKLIAANTEAIAWLDRAAAMSQIQWPAYRTGDAAAWRGDVILSPAGKLRVLLRIAAEFSHQHHDNMAAIHYLERLLALARIIDEEPEFLGHSIAGTMRSDVAQTLDDWAPGMPLDGENEKAVRSLVESLLQSPVSSDQLVRRFERETALYQQSITQDIPALGEWWIQPLAIDAFARRLSLQAGLLPIVQATNWQQVAAVSGPSRREPSNLANIVFAVSSPDANVTDAMRIHFRALTDARAAALILTAYLYRQDIGAFPDKPEALVPAYLPLVPVDPFAADGRPLRYRLDPGGPTVWSVGEDGKDQEGLITGITFAPLRFGRRNNQPDIVYGAALRAAMGPGPATMPSTPSAERH